jgi:hypothetical protein
MKKIQFFMLIAATTTLLFSCGNIKKKVEDKINEAVEEVANDLEGAFTSVNTVTVKDLFSVDIPTALTETYDLNEEASLQYENISDEYYVIAIDENKQEFFDAINEGASEDEMITEEEILDIYGYLQFTTFATDDQYFDTKDIEVNGLKAQQLDITSTFEDLGIFYRMACYEGEENLYFVVVWTMEDYKDDHDASMQNIIESFKEL